MKKIFLLIFSSYLFAVSPMFTGDSVVPNDKKYFKYNMENIDVEIIYSKENISFAKQVAKIEENLQKKYIDMYKWKFDETLYVGLISDYNQIANGFSTQWPNNRQINYIGGTQKIDYFCSKSWLSTLIYHETAHNYQVNLKKNPISSSLHSIFGNGVVFLPLPLILPNVAENPLMFEGNAVLNESWHGNGGRLYSGRFKAETIMQAKAGNLKSKYLYNQRLGFPYGDIAYIQGGFYHLYLAKTYGLRSTNNYFTQHSKYWYWPFMTNLSMKDAIGIDFEQTVNEFELDQISLLKEFKILEEKEVLSSQFFYPLNSNIDEIFFLINKSGVREPELVCINKDTKKVTIKMDSYRVGKVIKIDNKYFTQSSSKIVPTKIIQGLYDNVGFIKKSTESKMVQGYLSTAKMVYFDVKSSFDEPQLYIGKDFYDTVNSSVFIDRNDNIYYFKQINKERILYKNKVPIYKYKGFYGIVSDVDSKGRIYFIANSKLGSTVYRYDNGDVKRVSTGDNIIDAKLVGEDELLVAAIGENKYYYSFTKIENLEGTPYNTKLFFEDKEYYNVHNDYYNINNIDLNNSYNSFFDMHYSGSNFAIGYSDLSGLLGSLNINYSDPLAQNSANMFISRDTSEMTIAGAGYNSSAYLLKYSVLAYGVVDNNDRNNTRNYGIMANATLPFYTAGYYYGAIGLSYFQDYDIQEREPISGVLILQKSKTFGVSMYENSLNLLKLYGVSERKDKIFGGLYKFSHDLRNEWYIGLYAKYSQSNHIKRFEGRGVKVTNSIYQEDMDPSAIDMPSISSAAYVKRAGYAEINIAKVVNLSTYYFTFPLSLQRESIYGKYRYYNLLDNINIKYKANELTFGVVFASVILNSYKIPISMEYIYNDGNFIDDTNSFKMSMGISF